LGASFKYWVDDINTFFIGLPSEQVDKG